MKKLTYLSLMTCFFSCVNQVDFKPPTEKEIQKGIKESDRIQNKINSELRIIENLDEGIEKARIEQKPIALMFTGYGAVNSRKLEHESIIGNDEIFNILKDKYINIWLYVDSRQKISDSTAINNRYKNTGEKWKDLQINEYQSDFLPHIFILDSNGNRIDGGISYKESKKELLPLLKKHLE